MKIFLTGGHGFIGSRVVRRLVAEGHAARCLVREHSKTHRIDDLSFEKVKGDVRDRASLVEGMQGMESCIHLASISSWTEMTSDALENTILGGTENIILAAQEAAVKRVVFVSSSMAVNASEGPQVFDENSAFTLTDPKYRYPLAKHRAEKRALELAAETGVEVVTVNPAEVYGANDDTFVTAGNLRDIIKDWPALACTGGSAVTHVDDVAQGITAALFQGRPGERYILGGENLEVKDIVRLTLEIAGIKKPILGMPNGVLKGVVFGMAKVGLPTPVVPELLTYATLYWFMNSEKAKNELGYAPRPARACLEPAIRWLYEAGHVKGQLPNSAPRVPVSEA